MNWERVKGFCRRQTQKINENYRHHESTKDDEAEAGYRRILGYRKAAAQCCMRMEHLKQNSANSIALLEGMKEDLQAMEVEDLATTAMKIEMITLAMRKQQEALAETLATTTGTLRQYTEECSGIDNVFEDRKAKKLEFDFFRNKVTGLNRNPPGDPARIPRNEGRLQEWQRLYDEANDRLKNLSHTLTLQGIRTMGESTVSAATALSKYYGEVSQTWRASFGNAGVAAMAFTGAQAAAAAAAQKLPTVQQATASMAAANPAAQAAASQARLAAAQTTATAAAAATTAATTAAAAAQQTAAAVAASQQPTQGAPSGGATTSPAPAPGASGTSAAGPQASSPQLAAASPSQASPTGGVASHGSTWRTKPTDDDPFAM